ncbi:Hypothetical protein R9X50_00546000 [Acrodontium crateriforme]|uniref:Late endosomal/lysosomal adaptor and MAPK and MTOR activator-domain-containing protein n=1 Tax=Acrodontium crateriforme TaxID=150365 RepID=A0AAQ3RBJ3_9PEZI|nr:Hypothetical protein R9X50_00546000 [Acrodontium crateriforme]
MGICQSCLGRRRQPSQDIDETDDLLGASQHSGYGAIGTGHYAQPDEEELRRERAMLEHITTEAADNMIDVSHPTATELSSHFAQANHGRHRDPNGADYESVTDRDDHADQSYDEAEENAWLQSIQAAGVDTVTQVKGIESGALVMDISHLRQDPGLSSAKKALKSALR